MLTEQQLICILELKKIIDSVRAVNLSLITENNTKGISFEIKDTINEQKEFILLIFNLFDKILSDESNLSYDFTNEIKRSFDLISKSKIFDINLSNEDWLIVKEDINLFINDDKPYYNIYINNSRFDNIIIDKFLKSQLIAERPFDLTLDLDMLSSITNNIINAKCIHIHGSEQNISLNIKTSNELCQQRAYITFESSNKPSINYCFTVEKRTTLSEIAILADRIADSIFNIFNTNCDLYFDENGNFIDISIDSHFLSHDFIKRITRVNETLVEIEKAVNHENIIRTIFFTKSQYQSGISILSYFGQILKDKYPELKSNVSVIQEGELVKLMIACEVGSKDKINETLDQYALVLTNKEKPESLLEDKLQIARLEAKLELAAMEVNQTNKLLSLAKQYHARETLSLKEEIQYLRNTFLQLHSTNTQLTLGYANNFEKLIQLANGKDLVISSLRLIESMLKTGISENDRPQLALAVDKIKTDAPHLIPALKELAQNSAYGASGNILFGMLTSIAGMVAG